MIDMPNERFDSESSDKLNAVAERYETQLDKFKCAARKIEADEDEAAWDKRVKKVVKHKPVEKSE